MNKPSGLQMKYFVLKPAGSDAHAKASRAAMRTYANHIQETNQQLCDELRAWADNEQAALDAEKERERG